MYQACELPCFPSFWLVELGKSRNIKAYGFDDLRAKRKSQAGFTSERVLRDAIEVIQHPCGNYEFFGRKASFFN